jgi:hypothetical protein
MMPTTSKQTPHTMSQLSKLLLLLSLIIAAPPFTVYAEDQVLPYVYDEPLLINQSYPIGLKEEDLRNMTLADPKLRIAYVFLIRTARSGPKITDERTPEMVAVLADLKRRSDSATPLLLDIMAKNHNTQYEHLIPLIISRIGTIKIGPYLDYLREMVRTRPDEISAASNEVTAELFLEHGTPEDVKMLQDLAKRRPFLAPSLERAFDLQRYKNPDRSNTTQTTPTPKPLPVVQPTAQKKVTKAQPTASRPNEEPTSSTLWSVVAVLIVAAIGLLWLFLKGRK